MPIRRAADPPDDDFLFDLDADFMDPTGDPFEAPDFENGGLLTRLEKDNFHCY